ncbi:MAG TPA: hypothetical protein PKA63_13425 [Oligoflexia bacterium]|nr:hypothetical protein [Oligoflexia bacterium]HMP49662.1 hypothetical protein [Oligoflexia bacterium]
MASLCYSGEKRGQTSQFIRQKGFWRKMPRKRPKGTRRGTWLKTKTLDSEEDRHLQWAPDLGRYALNVHNPDRGERHLSTKLAMPYLSRLLRLAIDEGHDTFIVIHGSASGVCCWLRLLKRLFAKACTSFQDCEAISKIEIAKISDGLKQYLLQYAA